MSTVAAIINIIVMIISIASVLTAVMNSYWQAGFISVIVFLYAGINFLGVLDL
jgi:hypothetical protein